MKLSVLMIFLFALTRFCLADDSLSAGTTFRIIDYKPVGFRTQSLIISPSFDWGSRKSLDSNSYYHKEETGSVNGSLATSLSHYFRNQKNMADLEISTNAYFSGMANISTQEYDSDNEKTFYSNQSYPGLYYSISNSTRFRKYVMKNIFLEGTVSPLVRQQPVSRGISENSSISGYNLDSSYYHAFRNDSKNQTFTLSSELNGSIGAGWISDMTGAAIALHMGDCIGRLKGQPQKFTNAQLQDLASAVDRLRRRRIFDSRIANIESVDTLCQMLVAEKFVDTATVRLAMEINDIWNYGFSQPRNSGREFKCTPIVSVNYNHSKTRATFQSIDSIGPNDPSISARDVSQWTRHPDVNESNTTDLLSSYGAIVYAGFSNPYGRFFELDGSVEVSGTMNTLYDSVYSVNFNRGLFKGTYPNAMGKFSLALYWYPTLRTTMAFRNQLTGSGDFYFRSRTVTGSPNYSSWIYSQRRIYKSEFSTSLSIRYYLSPRCSYDIWGSGHYFSGSSRKSALEPYADFNGLRNWYVSVGTGLSYSLF
jgi:hypothetical protein